MFSKFSEDAQKVLLSAKDEMIKLKHPYVGSEHLILAILSNNTLAITTKLNGLGLNYDSYKEELINIVGIGKSPSDWFLYTPLLKRIIENAIYDSKELNEKSVTVERLFISLLEEGDGVGIRIIMSLNIDIDNLYNMINTKLKIKKSKKDKKMFLNDFSINFNKKVLANEVDPVVCRDDEVERVIEILSRRNKNNPLLIGEAGVGKTAIVEELTRRIVEGDVPNFLKNKVIYSVSISSMVAGTKYRGEFEERINKILKEVESDDDIILFIDEIHTIVGAGGAEGAIDASNILKPALARGKIKLIGATTIEEYHMSIEKDKALDRRFQKVDIKEPDINNTIKILKCLKPIYSSYHNVLIEDDIIKYIVEVADSYITNRKNPDKSIDILDEVCAKASLITTSYENKINDLNKELKNIIDDKNNAVINGNFKKANELKIKEQMLEDKINKFNLKNKGNKKLFITRQMVDAVVEDKTQIPIYKANNNVSKDIKNLEKYLNNKIKGQELIIKELCKYTKLIKSGISKDKPYSFLLKGPTGVGKTLLVKEYSNYLFNKNNFIRLDMSEYKEENAINKIIGSPPGYIGYQDDNYVLERVRNNPHSVILLDEIEKASPAVLKLFLQVLDEGIMHDASGRVVSFKHTIIFMTSNLGTKYESIGFTKEKADISIKEFLSVEFLNRLDKIFEFKKLDYKDIKNIVNNKLKLLINRYEEKEININISNKLVDEIIKLSDYDVYGARKIEKVIDDVITSKIIDMIIEGNNSISLLKA